MTSAMFRTRKALSPILVRFLNGDGRTTAREIMTRHVSFIDRDGVHVAGRDRLIPLIERMQRSQMAVRHELISTNFAGGYELSRLKLFHRENSRGEPLLWRLGVEGRRVSSLEAFRDGQMLGMNSLFADCRYSGQVPVRTPQPHA